MENSNDLELAVSANNDFLLDEYKKTIDSLYKQKLNNINRETLLLAKFNEVLKQKTLLELKDVTSPYKIPSIRLIDGVNNKGVFYQIIYKDIVTDEIIEYGDIYMRGGDINSTGSLRNVVNGFSRVLIDDEISFICGGLYSFIAINKTYDAFYTWGNNQNGQLGSGNTNPVVIPLKFTNTQNLRYKKAFFKSFLEGIQGFSMILRDDNTLEVCGKNTEGQLGLGNTIDRLNFTTLPLNNIDDVYIGSHFSTGVFAKTIMGELYAWGCNNCGQLGVGHKNNLTSPTKITGFDNNVLKVATSTINDNGLKGVSFIITNDGTVFGCGYNANNSLSQDNFNDSLNFIPLKTIDNQILSNIKEIYPSSTSPCLALDNDNNLYSWGAGDVGLGDDRNSKSKAKIIARGVKKISIVEGARYGVAVLFEDNHIEVFGHNENGQLGSPIGNIKTLTKIFTPKGIKDISLQGAGDEITFVATDGVHIYACGNDKDGNTQYKSNSLQMQIICK